MIPLKSAEDLKNLKVSGKILARVMKEIQLIIEPGISTQDIDNLAQELITKEGAIAAFKGYKGFPASICTSVNEEIVHGIPGEKKIKEGDIISLDLGINYAGFYTDAAVTVGVGKITPKLRDLIRVTKESLSIGIKKANISNYLSDISHAIQSYVEKKGYSVVRQFVGHGIGSSLHEEPEIPNFGQAHQGPILTSGMVLAIEPMVNMGTWECVILDNGWTAATKDSLASAHFEHTIAITEKGPEILTN